MIDIKHTALEIVRGMTNERLTDNQKVALEHVARIVIGNQIEKLTEKKVLKNWSIWAEGYCANETEGKWTEPSYMGKHLAGTFDEACKRRFLDDKYFDAESMTYWGCKLYGRVCEE